MRLTFEKLNELTKTLAAFIHRDPVPLTDWRIVDDLGYDVPLPAEDDPAWQPLAPDAPWAGRLRWAWLRTQVTIPPSYDGKPAALRLDLDALPNAPGTRLFSPPEALVRVAGIDTPPQTVDAMHHRVWLSDAAPPGQLLTITLAAFGGSSTLEGHRVRFREAALAWIDREVEALYWDARVLLDTIAILPEAAPERGFYLRALDNAFAAIDWLNPPDEAFTASVAEARARLHAAVFDRVTDSATLAPRPLIHALGHAHIDVEWLWPLDVTRGKAERTFATALALMERYPAYTFTQSQPQLYQLLQQTWPELYEQVRARVREGRINATGATWVEMDTNLPGGESLARQFLFGMRFFEQALGVRPEVLWLPDVFGYCAALPQLMQQAGIRYFFTSKLSWNQQTSYPYDTFWWEGVDGTRVLTHLATTPELAVERYSVARNTYNATMVPEEIYRTWTQYKQKAYNHHLAMAYGLGDGGGGPTHEMIERRERMDDLPGLPQVRHSTAEDFFHALEATVPPDLPRWVGELYFQMHRGTYTSQARTKRYNRKSEALLHNAEAVAALAHLLGEPYPQDALHEAWRVVLLHQFHDILPGSSIGEVYAEVEREYERAQGLAYDALDGALDAVTRHLRYDRDMQGFAVFNTLGTALGGPVELELPGEGPVEIVAPDGTRIPFQWVDEDARHALIVPADVPAYGYRGYVTRPAEDDAAPEAAYPVQASATALDNGLLRAEFDAQGRLLRLYDYEHGRDVLAEGEIGNQLWAYVDRPHQWDAWEVEAYVEDQGWPIEPGGARLLEAGPLRATLEVDLPFNRSQITQRISLLAGGRALIFETDVDWRERHILLKAHFPLAIRAMDATYEIQFGTVQRPTHDNTAWDLARHEVPAQQWADLSEAGYGVALLNDCKYGYSTRDHNLAISLLRAPTYPDPKADQGAHTVIYALYPHMGDWRHGVIEQARRLNHPLLVQAVEPGGTWLPVEFGLARCETPGVQIETIKKAEDGDDLIVRVYEAHGGRAPAALRFAAPVAAAEEVNLLEEPRGPVKIDGDALRFKLAPYQIRSFRVRLGDLLTQQLG